MKIRCASSDSKASRRMHNWKPRFRVPSIDFTFKTDPLDTSKCDFAVMGTEVNGKYYEAAEELNLAQMIVDGAQLKPRPFLFPEKIGDRTGVL